MAKKFMSVKYKPVFKTSYYEHKINYNWARLQGNLMEMGEEATEYVKKFINTNVSREGSTGNLAGSINFHLLDTTAKIHFGIGDMEELKTTAPYWFVVNFGNMFNGGPYIPNHGRATSGSFDGDRPNSASRGTGVGKQRWSGPGEYVMFPSNPIKAMNYIEALQMYVRIRTAKISKNWNKI